LQAARPHIEAGRFHLVEDMPNFSYSVYAVYPAKATEQLMDRVRHGLRAVASAAANHRGQTHQTY
jgi:hypothetical protein